MSPNLRERKIGDVAEYVGAFDRAGRERIVVHENDDVIFRNVEIDLIAGAPKILPEAAHLDAVLGVSEPLGISSAATIAHDLKRRSRARIANAPEHEIARSVRIGIVIRSSDSDRACRRALLKARCSIGP